MFSGGVSRIFESQRCSAAPAASMGIGVGLNGRHGYRIVVKTRMFQPSGPTG